VGEVLETRHGERRKMKKKLGKLLSKAFPYVFNGALIALLLQGSTNYARVACWLMWMFGAGNFVIGASLIAWNEKIAETAIKNRGTSKGVEGWFKPTTNGVPTAIAWCTAIIAVNMGYVWTATVYAAGVSFVLLGVHAVKDYIKTNYVDL